MPSIDVVFGTEEEFWAVINTETDKWHGKEPVTDAERTQVEAWVEEIYKAEGMPDTIVLKRGSKGVTIFDRQEGVIDVPGFPVEVLNTVGAGDAFASGLIYSRLNGKEWYDSARFANACGAIVVTRHGCGDAMPTLEEVQSFMSRQ